MTKNYGITPSTTQLQKICIGHLAKFAEELSGELYISLERAFNSGTQLAVDSTEAVRLRRIYTICAQIKEITASSAVNENLREALFSGLILLAVANDPESDCYVSKTFVANAELEKLHLLVNAIP